MLQQTGGKTSLTTSLLAAPVPEPVSALPEFLRVTVKSWNYVAIVNSLFLRCSSVCELHCYPVNFSIEIWVFSYLMRGGETVLMYVAVAEAACGMKDSLLHKAPKNPSDKRLGLSR